MALAILAVRMSVSRWAFFVALLAAWPGSAAAEEWPSSVRGLKVVIPEAKGKKADGKTQLSATLRRTITEAVGPLVPSRGFEKAQKDLKLKGDAAFEPANLAAAGKTAGAQFVLAVEITKKKWLYTAHAVLINTETGQAQMDFRSEFYKPATDASDRGTRIAKRAIGKLAELAASGQLPPIGAVATNDPPPPPSGTDDKLEDDKLEDDKPVTDTKVEDPPPPPPPVRNDPPPPPPVEQAVTPPPPPPPPPSAPPPSSAAVATIVTPVPEPESEIFRFHLTAGSGLLRTYGLSSASVDSSNLSYSLVPLGLFAAGVELVAPSVPIAIALNGSFRPVRYKTRVLDDQSTAAGKLIDASVLAGFHVGIGGSGRQVYKVIPAIGARLSVGDVAENQGNTVLSATSMAVIGGLGLRLPFNDVLEVSVSLDGGLILSYSERPVTTGDNGAGFTVGGELGARIWLSDSIGIAFDNHFTYDRVTFEGAPTRALPEDEQGQLTNATISIRDLRTSIGIAFRI